MPKSPRTVRGTLGPAGQWFLVMPVASPFQYSLLKASKPWSPLTEWILDMELDAFFRVSIHDVLAEYKNDWLKLTFLGHLFLEIKRLAGRMTENRNEERTFWGISGKAVRDVLKALKQYDVQNSEHWKKARILYMTKMHTKHLKG